jgi:hypothetical protein
MNVAARMCSNAQEGSICASPDFVRCLEGATDSASEPQSSVSEPQSSICASPDFMCRLQGATTDSATVSARQSSVSAPQSSVEQQVVRVSKSAPDSATVSEPQSSMKQQVVEERRKRLCSGSAFYGEAEFDRLANSKQMEAKKQEAEEALCPTPLTPQSSVSAPQSSVQQQLFRGSKATTDSATVSEPQSSVTEPQSSVNGKEGSICAPRYLGGSEQHECCSDMLPRHNEQHECCTDESNGLVPERSAQPGSVSTDEKKLTRTATVRGVHHIRQHTSAYGRAHIRQHTSAYVCVSRGVHHIKGKGPMELFDITLPATSSSSRAKLLNKSAVPSVLETPTPPPQSVTPPQSAVPSLLETSDAWPAGMYATKRFAYVCSRMLTYAHVCVRIRMLTYADVC